MVSRFLPLTARLFILCLLLIAGTRVLARRDPPPHIAALLPDPSCQPPCWQGLRPGYIKPETLQTWIDNPPIDWQTRITANDTLPPGYDNWQIALLDSDSFRLTVVRFDNPQVDRLMLAPDDLVLGDLIAALGEPDFVDFSSRFNTQNRMMLDFRVFFQEPRLIASGTMQLNNAVLHPGIRVDALVYEAPPWVRPILSFDWRGLGRITRYYPNGVGG